MGTMRKRMRTTERTIFGVEGMSIQPCRIRIIMEGKKEEFHDTHMRTHTTQFPPGSRGRCIRRRRERGLRSWCWRVRRGRVSQCVKRLGNVER